MNLKNFLRRLMISALIGTVALSATACPPAPDDGMGALLPLLLVGSATPTPVVTDPSTSVPGVPTGLTATAGNASAALSWTAVSGASYYKVYYSTSATVTTASSWSSTLTTSTTISSLTNGTAYYFKVAAVNAFGESALQTTPASATPDASIVSTVPAVPTGLTATAGNASVALSWTTVSGATSYKVYYATSSTVTTSSTMVTAATTSTTISSLTNGTIYYFKVAAVNSVGDSALQTTPASATPVAPAVPSNSYSIGALTTTTATPSSSYTFTLGITGTKATTATVYFSTDNLISIYDTAATGTVSITGTATSQSVTVTLPSTMVGIYYVGIRDGDAVTAVSSNTVTVQSVLSYTSSDSKAELTGVPTVSASVAAATDLSITVPVDNDTGLVWVYVSTTSSQTLISGKTPNNYTVITPGTAQNVTLPVMIPRALATGTYQIFVKTAVSVAQHNLGNYTVYSETITGTSNAYYKAFVTSGTGTFAATNVISKRVTVTTAASITSTAVACGTSGAPTAITMAAAPASWSGSAAYMSACYYAITVPAGAGIYAVSLTGFLSDHDLFSYTDNTFGTIYGTSNAYSSTTVEYVSAQPVSNIIYIRVVNYGALTGFKLSSH